MVQLSGSRLCVFPFHLMTVFLVLGRCDSVLIYHDYHVEVTVICPESPDEPALVTIVTNMHETYPFAFCYNGHQHEFVPIDASTYMLEVGFDSDSSDSQCVFNREGDTYTLNAYVPESNGIIYGNEEPHPVSCSFGGNEDAEPPNLPKSLQPVKQLSTFMGVVGDSDVRLSVVDIDGNEITGNLALGRYVKLKAWLIGNYSSEVSFQAVSCEAISASDSYMFLIGGCGDGTILQHESGFITSGKFAESPPFKVFYLDRLADITFNCTFVLCDSACDGSSCDSISRRKRESVTKMRFIKHVTTLDSPDSAVSFTHDVDDGRYVRKTWWTGVVEGPQLHRPVPNVMVVDVGKRVVMVTVVPAVFMLLTATLFVCVILLILQVLKIKLDRRLYVKNVGLKDCTDI